MTVNGSDSQREADPSNLSSSEAARRPRMVDVAIIVIVFAIAVAITNPIGNFPLDDDWDFSLSTWHLVHAGQVQHTPFTSNIAVLQYFWGALWTILFGESSTVLRFCTLFLTLASTILIYVILRRAEVPER